MKNLSLISIMLIALNYGYSQTSAFPKLGIYQSGTAILWDSINGIDSAVIDQNLNHLLYKNGTVHSNLPISAFDSICFGMPGGLGIGIDQITATTVYCYSQASSNYPLTAFGVCWSTSSFPTIPSINQYPGFISNSQLSAAGYRYIIGLQPSTTYHFRSYATIYGVTYYSWEKIVTTLPPCAPLPTVTTDPVTSITYHTATGGGKVTSQGCSAVTKEGVCYGFSDPPDLFNYTKFMTGVGYFSGQITVSPSSKYYIRAFAFNNGGIAYGNVDSFSTPAAPGPSGKIEFYCTGQNATGISVGINIYDSPSYSNQVASGCIIAWHPLGQQINCQNAPTDYIQTLPVGTYYFKAFDLNGSVCDSGPIGIVANGCTGKNVGPGFQIPNYVPGCTNCYCHH